MNFNVFLICREKMKEVYRNVEFLELYATKWQMSGKYAQSASWAWELDSERDMF
jgi:hypothetical protein